MATRKIGRNAGSGRFISVQAAERNKKGAVVETVKVKTERKRPKLK